MVDAELNPITVQGPRSVMRMVLTAHSHHPVVMIAPPKEDEVDVPLALNTAHVDQE